MREATKRRWTRSSLDCWCLEARTEIPVRPLSVEALLPELVTIGGRGTWSGVRGCSTIGPEVPLAPGDRKESVGYGEGDRGGTVDRLAVDAEMSVVKAGTNDGGSFLSLYFIV